MQDLISNIAQKVGISEDLANTAVTQILSLFEKYGEGSEIATLVEKIPGAEDFLSAERAASIETPNASGGLLDGLMGMVSGGGDIMSTVNELTNQGMGMGDVKTVASELSTYAREHAGDEAVDQVLSKIPGLSSFI